jgi:hypothetical protein
MELALSLEKLNYIKLVHLDKVATDAEDYNLADYVDEMLDGACARAFLSYACLRRDAHRSMMLMRARCVCAARMRLARLRLSCLRVCISMLRRVRRCADQTKDVKRAADYVSQLRRVGKGHGTWAWDQQLYEEYE